MYERSLLQDLIRWKNDPSRKPLILRGARQVGKTTLVRMFAGQFDHFIYLNLDKPQDRQIFERNVDLENLIRILYLRENISPAPGAEILVFIDEIQNSAPAIQMLRYFYEEAGHIHVIAAGSLLETLLDRQVSFPVGRVEYLVLRPFSFREFLAAKKETQAISLCDEIPFPSYGHQKLLELFTSYCLIGGMPEVLNHYLPNRDIVAVGRIFDSLITTFMDDVEKYAGNEKQRAILRHVIYHAVRRAGERITFERFGASNYKSRDIGECFRMLEKTFLLSLDYPVTGTTIPLVDNRKKSPKLHLLDTGMLNFFAGMQMNILSGELIDNLFEGKIAEHIAGQELLSTETSPLARNYFWVKEKKQSSEEVDYVLQVDSLLIPVEVKLGKTGRLRSLMEFIDLCPHHFGVRVYSGPLKMESFRTLRNKPFTLLNLPFYLAGRIREYIRWALRDA